MEASKQFKIKMYDDDSDASEGRNDDSQYDDLITQEDETPRLMERTSNFRYLSCVHDPTLLHSISGFHLVHIESVLFPLVQSAESSLKRSTHGPKNKLDPKSILINCTLLSQKGLHLV